MKPKPAIKILFLLLFACSQGSAQQTNAFTAKQAVDYALKNSAQVKNALLDIQIQRQTNKEVASAAFPQISGNISINDFLSIPTSLIPAEFTGGPPGTFIPLRFGTKYSATYGADLQQMDSPGDSRVVVTIQAVRVNAVDLSG